LVQIAQNGFQATNQLLALIHLIAAVAAAKRLATAIFLTTCYLTSAKRNVANKILKKKIARHATALATPAKKKKTVANGAVKTNQTKSKTARVMI
jgi:enamine deaminase RidA (YjgF/YER057c/UK114 family)